MKKKLFYSFIKKSCLYFLLIITLSNISGQAQPPDLPAKPFMWGPKQTGKDQAAHFNSIKLKKISANSGRTQTNRFSLGNFLGMIDYFYKTYTDDFQYLRVYIGIYTGTTSVPVGSNKKIVFIFAPAKSDSTSSDIAYYILPRAFDPNNPSGFKIAAAEKIKWTDKFVSAMPLETIDKDDPDNLYPSPSATDRVLSDTRYVTYCAGDLLALVFTKNHYSTSSDLSNNVVGYLGAYAATGTIVNKIPGRYKNRINMHFDLVNNNKKEVYLDDIPGFLDLPPGVTECSSFLNNGQLCPTYCP
jgi:hypothetical protein